MKKYKIIYLIVIVVLLVLVCTKGIRIGIIINSFDDYKNSGIIDGFQGNTKFLIFNVIIIISIFITSLIITFKNDNKIKHKKIFLLIIIIALLFIPIFKETRSGGIAGIINKDYYSIINVKKIYNIIVKRYTNINENKRRNNVNKEEDKTNEIEKYNKSNIGEEVEYTLISGYCNLYNQRIQFKNAFISKKE